MIDEKRLFDAIRAIKGSALTQKDVTMVNAALKPIVGRVSLEGLELIHSFEGYSTKTYPDPGPNGLPVTGGWGTTRDAEGNPFKLGVTYEKSYWEALFKRDLAKFEAAVKELCPITTQNQFDALVSFAYNVGAGNLATSTLRRLHNAGDYEGAAKEFSKWTKAKGKVLPGLVKRREAEARLYAR